MHPYRMGLSRRRNRAATKWTMRRVNVRDQMMLYAFFGPRMSSWSQSCPRIACEDASVCLQPHATAHAAMGAKLAHWAVTTGVHSWDENHDEGSKTARTREKQHEIWLCNGFDVRFESMAAAGKNAVPWPLPSELHPLGTNNPQYFALAHHGSPLTSPENCPFILPSLCLNVVGKRSTGAAG